jgi:hypothetical protein
MVTAEDAYRLEAQIAELAKTYMERPETRPGGFTIGVGGDDIMGRDFRFSPYAEIEACLKAAAEELAPDWDHMMERYAFQPPKMRLGMYQGRAGA